MVNFEDKLDDMANCYDDKLLVDADPVPGVVRELCGSVLEHHIVLHCVRLEASVDNSVKSCMNVRYVRKSHILLKNLDCLIFYF